MEVSFRGLPRQHITDSSSLSLNDCVSKMPEREGWSCGVPVKPGLWQPKVKSILRGCSGFTGNSLPLNVLGFIKASPVQISTAATKAWSDGSWKLKPSVDFIVLWVSLEETSPTAIQPKPRGVQSTGIPGTRVGRLHVVWRSSSAAPAAGANRCTSASSTTLALLCASCWKPAFDNG